jgi:hypothetical protein
MWELLKKFFGVGQSNVQEQKIDDNGVGIEVGGNWGAVPRKDGSDCLSYPRTHEKGISAKTVVLPESRVRDTPLNPHPRRSLEELGTRIAQGRLDPKTNRAALDRLQEKQNNVSRALQEANYPTIPTSTVTKIPSSQPLQSARDAERMRQREEEERQRRQRDSDATYSNIQNIHSWNNVDTSPAPYQTPYHAPAPCDPAPYNSHSNHNSYSCPAPSHDNNSNWGSNDNNSPSNWE